MIIGMSFPAFALVVQSFQKIPLRNPLAARKFHSAQGSRINAGMDSAFNSDG